MDIREKVIEEMEEIIHSVLSFGRECSDEWWAYQKSQGMPFLKERADQLLAINIEGRYRLAIVDTKAELPKHYIWPQTTQSREAMRAYQSGEIDKEEHNIRQSKLHNEEIVIYAKAQQDMLDAGWVKKIT